MLPMWASLPSTTIRTAAIAAAFRRQARSIRTSSKGTEIHPARRGVSRSRQATIVGSCLAALALNSIAHCASMDERGVDDSSSRAGKDTPSSFGNKDEKANRSDDPLQRLLDGYADMFVQLGFSGTMGVCTAMAIKRVSRSLAVATGAIFAGLQVLSYAGYIRIDYGKLSSDVQRSIDVTGDKVFNVDDVKALWRKLMDALVYQLPSATAFSSGFAMGLYLF